jgi:hypothetical protein
MAIKWGADIEKQGLPMFQELIDDYRRQAAQYIADALELESGRWRATDQEGDYNNGDRCTQAGPCCDVVWIGWRLWGAGPLA